MSLTLLRVNIRTLWRSGFSLSARVDKPPLIHYCQQGTMNKVEVRGFQFCAHSFQSNGKPPHKLISQGSYLFSTLFLPSSIPVTIGLPGSMTIHVFQRLDALYCQLCYHILSPLRPTMTAITYRSKVTTPLLNHLKNKHSNAEKKMTQPTNIPAQDYNRLVCFALVSNNLPFRIVDNDAFRQILQKANIPHRTSMSTVQLTSLFNDFKDALRAAIGDSFIHISFDLWSSVAMNHYIVVSCQWISREWKIEKAGLAIFDLEGQCAPDSAVERTLGRMNINQKSIFSIVTDGAANEVSAANFSSFCDDAEHVWCYLHKLNLCISDGFAGKGIGTTIDKAGSSAREDRELQTVPWGLQIFICTF